MTLAEANAQASLPVAHRLPAESLGPGCRAARQGWRARGYRLTDQAGDRAGSDPSSHDRSGASRPCSGRCRIRDRHGLPYGPDGFELALQSGRSVLNEPAALQNGFAAAQTLVRTRAPACPGATEQRPLSTEKPARSLPEPARCIRTNSDTCHVPRNGVWSSGPRRGCTNQILTFDAAARDAPGRVGPCDDASLVHRAGLSGVQTRDWAWPGLATTGDETGAASIATAACASRPTGSSSLSEAAFPLRPKDHRAASACPTRRLQTPRCPGSSPNDTCPIPSRLCACSCHYRFIAP